MREILSLVSTKIPRDEFQRRIDDLYFQIRYGTDAYGKNFKYLFSDVLRWVITDYTNQSVQETEKLSRCFPVEELITREINSEEELKHILEQEDVLPEPNIEGFTRGEVKAEFVDSSLVVGGSGIGNWAEISTSEGRGLENVFKIIGEIKSGSFDINGKDQRTPIQVYEFGGKYYIDGDGRHRIAALKALGVSFAPVLVTHLSSSNLPKAS